MRQKHSSILLMVNIEKRLYKGEERAKKEEKEDEEKKGEKRGIQYSPIFSRLNTISMENCLK